MAILDADKEGFLRSETSLIQTVGRAARNVGGHVVMYADTITESMDKAISETNRRRRIQDEYNKAHHITPTSVKKAVRELISISKKVEEPTGKLEKDMESMSVQELKSLSDKLTNKMHAAAAELKFELAAELRDKLIELKKYMNGQE